ncbi:MAG: tRNA pseudouridine(38-40) synthase TruA [bacterium]
MSVRNTRLLIEYDGSDFCGWQRQVKVRTVEGELLAALAPILSSEPEIIAAARTDSGVHALGQVANFTAVSPLEPERLAYALNSALPPDVRIIEADEAPLAFNARYDAVSRRYVYVVSLKPTAVWRGYRWYVKWKLDVEAMNQAIAAVLGEHDFSAFTCKEEQRSPWIAISEASAEEIEPGVVTVRLRGKRFLRKMVRNLVGTLVEIGRGRMPPSELCDILASRDRKRAGPCAPPHGLYLVKVEY